MTKLGRLKPNKQVFFVKEMSSQSIANALHFSPLGTKITPAPPIFEQGL